MNRRQFLKSSALIACAGFAEVVLDNPFKLLNLPLKVANQVLSGSNMRISEMTLVQPLQAAAVTLNPLSIPMFENQLTGPPPVYVPNVVTSPGGVVRHEYIVAMSSFTQQLLPPSINLLTPVWGYGGVANDAVTGASLGFFQSTPGPTFEALRGIPIQVKWQNNITSPYMLAVDPTLHWANPDSITVSAAPFPSYPPGFPDAQSPVPLVTHLHGGQNQSFYDGGPNAWFTANGKHGSEFETYQTTDSNAAVYFYPNTQQPTTLWYHDHALGLTRLNVGSGLAGFYLIRDSNDKVAPLLPSGKYEVPLVIQDRMFGTDGSLYYPTSASDPQYHPYWIHMFEGNVIMVNGKVWPNMNVDRGQYRFRLLNGSNSRIYILNFSNLMEFIQIGSDGGYLKAPLSTSSISLAPAERADLIVDFSSLAPGETVVLQNSNITSTAEQSTIGQIMQFTVNATKGTTPFNINSTPQPFNPTLSASAFPTLPSPTKTRFLTLFEISGEPNNGEALLDGQAWSAPISETPQLGATEDWVIINPTMDAHPIHLHLIQFQLVQRQLMSASAGYEDVWVALNGKAPFNHPTLNVPNLSQYLYTTVNYPQPQEQCWKDTITVNAAEVVTIRVRFAAQDGSSFPFDATAGPGYVWHCHLLEHEDHEMMRPYKIMAPASETLPIAASAVGAGAALSLAYYYQRRRKKKRQENEELVSQTNYSDRDSTTKLDQTADYREPSEGR